LAIGVVSAVPTEGPSLAELSCLGVVGVYFWGVDPIKAVGGAPAEGWPEVGLDHSVVDLVDHGLALTVGTTRAELGGVGNPLERTHVPRLALIRVFTTSEVRESPRRTQSAHFGPSLIIVLPGLAWERLVHPVVGTLMTHRTLIDDAIFTVGPWLTEGYSLRVSHDDS